jgi:hypothetical protein
MRAVINPLRAQTLNTATDSNLLLATAALNLQGTILV